MKKTITTILLISSISLYGSNNEVKKAYNSITDGSLNNLSSTEFINEKSQYATKEFEYIKKLQKEKRKSMTKEQRKQNELFIKALKEKTKGMTYKEAENYIKTLYKGNEYLSKEEAILLLKQIKGLGDIARKDHEFILYFFSKTVPKNATTNVILDVGILRENGIDIETKQYLRGPTKDFKNFVMNWKNYIDEYPAQLKTYIVNNFHLKLDPRFFKTYDIKKAPAMALAICDSAVPDIKSCKIKYLIRGNVSLEVFFDKISNYEKKYKEYVRYLQANKIIKKKKEVKRR